MLASAPFCVFAQLSGTYKIGTPLATGCGGACNYTTLTAPTGAFAAVNAQGINGNVIFEIYTDLAETGASVLPQFTDLSGPHTITIRPNTNAMRILSGSKTGDGLIAILGGDRVIIDGRNPSDATLSYTNRYLTIRNTSTSGPAINIGNDAVSISVRSVILESRNATATGVLNVGGGSISGNDDLTIDYCDIKNDATDATNLPQNGINMAGGATQGNDNIQITNNRIYNFFIPTGPPAGGTGINVGNYNSTVTISGNSIYQDADRTTNVNAVYRGIYVNSNAGTGFRIINNFIGSNAAGAAGAVSTVSTTGSKHVKASMIEVADIGFSSLTLISGNTIRGFATSNTQSAGIADAGLIGVLVARGYVDVRENIIGDATAGLTANYDASAIACSGVVAGIAYITNTSGTGIQGEIEGNFINNLVANNTGTTASIATEVVGIYVDQQTGTNALTIKKNLVGQLTGAAVMTTNNNATNAQNTVGIDISRASVAVLLDRNKIGNISSKGTATSSYVRGISSTAANSLTVTSNEIFSLASAANNAAVSGAAVGIYASNSAASGLTYSKNSVYNITNPNGVIIAGVAIGLVNTGVNPRVENNMITLGNSLTTDGKLYGIYNGVTLPSGSSVQVYANTAVITGAGAGGNTNRTGGFWRDGDTVFDLKANLCLNQRTGGGGHFALGTTSNTGGSSNYNLLYAATTANLAYTNAFGARSFAQWQALGQDANSKNINIASKFISIPNGNLRIPDDGSTIVANNIVDKGAANAAGNPVSDDIDKAHRTNITDIGASEVLVTWLGATNTDWNTTTNWSGGVIPSCGGRDLIKIGPGVPNQPNVTVSASFRELVILDGATVTVSGSGSLNQCSTGTSPYSLIVNGTLTVASNQAISLYGDFYQNNIFTPASGTVSFVAASGQLLDGDEDPVTFNNLTISGGGAKTLAQDIKITGTLALNSGIITTSTANVLTFTSTGTYTGGSTTSYISGPAAKETSFTTPFYFPIGKSGKFRMAAIEPSNTTATTFTAEYFPQSARTNVGTPMDGSLTNVSDIEYWKIDRSTGSASGYVHLTWDANSGVSNNQADRDQLSVVRWDGSQWVNQYQLANSGTGSAGEVTSGYIFVYNTYFTLGSSTLNNPLPVELINFMARVVGTKVKVTWETLSERDNDYFTIEVSSDGEKFRSIGDVLGHGTTKEHQYYTLMDENPQLGISYYRLIQVDRGGYKTYSEVRKVNVTELAEPAFVVSPNPTANEDLNFTLSAFGENSIVGVEIFDPSGRKINQFEMQCDNKGFAQLDMKHSLAQGFYIIKAASVDHSVQTKLVVR